MDHGQGPFGDAIITTVTKVTLTEIVCATGHVFRRDTGYAKGQGRGHLLPISDARVRDAVARQQLAALPLEIEKLCRNAGHRAVDVSAAIDRVEAAVGRAREAIVTLS